MKMKGIAKTVAVLIGLPILIVLLLVGIILTIISVIYVARRKAK